MSCVFEFRYTFCCFLGFSCSFAVLYVMDGSAFSDFGGWLGVIVVEEVLCSRRKQ